MAKKPMLLSDLFHETLKDIYFAENKILKTLPKIQMPNRSNFLPARLEDIHDLKKRGCRLGQCPESTTSK